MATEEVMPAMKSRKNHMAPKIWPRGIFWKMTGSAWKPRLKAPSLGDDLGLGEAEEGDRHRDGDGAAQDDLGEFVGRWRWSGR